MRKLALILMGVLSAQAVTIRGTVVDYKTGEPIGKALVSIRSQNIEATTGADGRFKLPGVQSGTVDLFVSTVNYGLLKKAVEVPAGEEMQLHSSLRRVDPRVLSAGTREAPMQPPATSWPRTSTPRS